MRVMSFLSRVAKFLGGLLACGIVTAFALWVLCGANFEVVVMIGVVLLAGAMIVGAGLLFIVGASLIAEAVWGQ